MTNTGSQQNASMEGHTDRDGLRQCLNSMLAHESRLEETLARMSSVLTEYLESPRLIGHLQTITATHRDSLRAHLDGLKTSGIPAPPPTISELIESSVQGGRHDTVLSRLETVASIAAQVAFRYGVVHGYAHRFYEVETADLADQHRVDYLAAGQILHQCVGDVVVHEMRADDYTCRCQCPSCSPGICLCWHAHSHELTGPGVPREGIVVRQPRPDSSAERAGLRHGDVILAVAGDSIGSYQDMLDRMREHEPGDDVKLSVQRPTGAREQVIIAR